MKGLLLIGGKSTRLPGKCFLPMKDGMPVFMSALNLFGKTKIKEVVIPVLPGHVKLFERIIDRFLGHMSFPLVEPIFTVDSQSGVCNAITRTAETADDDLFVLCGDNIYGFDVPESLMKGGVAVRQMRPEFSRHLAFYNEEPLITPWVLPGLWARQAYLYDSVPRFLNAQRAPHVYIQEGEWWDIGTEETYEAYWTS